LPRCCRGFESHGRRGANRLAARNPFRTLQLHAQQQPGPGDFRYTMKVRLKKGAFKIVITLRDELSNEIGSATEGIRL